jgi:hypothetical protein
MHVPQADTARGSAWTRIGRRAMLSVAFLVAAVTTLVVLPGRSGPVAAALLISGAFAAWVAALMVDAIGANRPPRTATRARRIFRKRPAVIAAGQRDDPRVQPGDYFSTGHALYRVEHLAGARVLVEDCRSGDLIDVDRETCAAFERVKRSASP